MDYQDSHFLAHSQDIFVKKVLEWRFEIQKSIGVPISKSWKSIGVVISNGEKYWSGDFKKVLVG